jgi:DNA-binding GntR family transcriptional regulator
MSVVSDAAEADYSALLPARRALADDVYDAVQGLLMDQVIAPGARVSIDGIARRLNVSQTPVREALARLESEGLVVKQPLKGYTSAPLLDADGVRQLFEMRRLLEPEATRLAAERIGPDAVAELEALVADMHRSGEVTDTGDDRYRDYKDFMHSDAEFHRRIAEQSGNRLLVDAIVRLRAHQQNYRVYFRHGIAAETADEHEAILAALRRGDADAGDRAMRDHISRAYTRIAAGVAGDDHTDDQPEGAS